MNRIYRPSGGYRKLHAFNFAAIIHLGTIRFCKRYIPWKEDPLGKQLGQMTGASRSGKQNIVEASERAKTSAETDIKLTDVAKASLSELQGDLEDYLVQKGSIPWSIHDPRYQAVMAIQLGEFEYTEDLLHDYWAFLLKEKQKFDTWLEEGDDITIYTGAKPYVKYNGAWCSRDRLSTFFPLDIGTNTLTISADSGVANLIPEIAYAERYQ